MCSLSLVMKRNMKRTDSQSMTVSQPPFLLLIVCVFQLTVGAQPPPLEWSRSFGGTDVEDHASLFETEDENFLMSYMSYLEGNFDVFVQRLSTDGQVIWSMRLGGDRSELDPQMVAWGDGESLVAVLSYSLENESCVPLWVVRTGGQGDTLWTRQFCIYPESRPIALDRKSNGDFVICVSRNVAPGDREGFGLLLLDEQGDSIGFRDYPNIEGAVLRDPLDMAVTSDDHVVVCGASADYQHDPPLFWPNPFLLAMDSNGDSLWESVSPIGNWFISCNPTQDRGFVLAVHDSNHLEQRQFVVVRLDSLYEVQWQRVYGHQGFDEAYVAQECSDSSVVVLGYSSTPLGDSQVMLMKLSQSGDSLWSTSYGGDRLENSQHSALHQTADGGFITAQFSNSYSDCGDVDVWVVRFGPDGAAIEDRRSYAAPRELSISAFPNPFNPTTTISFDLSSTAPIQLKVFNTLGQQIAELANETFTAGRHEILFDGSEYPSGIYFYSLSAPGQQKTEKLLLLK